MSSSTIRATSPRLPATEPGALLRVNQWLRVGLVAAVAAGVLASLFGYFVAEPVLGKAVALESAGHEQMGMSPEVFSRHEQQGGFVLGELVFAAGVAFLLAGAAFLLSRPGGRPARLWIGMILACGWSAVVLPAFAFPPLPPGVESSLSIDWRQAGYLGIVATGLLSCFLAWRVAEQLSGVAKTAAAGLCIVVPAVIVLVAMPAQKTIGAPPADMLRDFRLGSWGTQAVFWLSFLTAGWLLLRPRTGADYQSTIPVPNER